MATLHRALVGAIAAALLLSGCATNDIGAGQVLPSVPPATNTPTPPDIHSQFSDKATFTVHNSTADLSSCWNNPVVVSVQSDTDSVEVTLVDQATSDDLRRLNDCVVAIDPAAVTDGVLKKR